MPPERWCGTCAQHDHYPCQPVDESLCGAPDYHKWRPKECATCPLEGRVQVCEAHNTALRRWADGTVEKHLRSLEARVTEHAGVHEQDIAELEARLQALELAIIADVAEIEKLKTLAEQGTDLFEEHDERLQALERPAAPAQRQPEHWCVDCQWRYAPCHPQGGCDCKDHSHWQPRQGAGK